MVFGAMNEILFWDNLSIVLQKERELLTMLNPNEIAEDRRKYADEKHGFLLQQIPTKQDFLKRIAVYERDGKPLWVAGRNPCCDDLSLVQLKKAHHNVMCRGKRTADMMESIAKGASKEYVEFYVQQILKHPREDILELTVGAGFGTASLVRSMREADFYTGVDIDFKCAKNGESILTYYGKSGLAIATSLWNLPFDDETFSVVYSQCGLNECREIPAILSEAARVLKPGGRMVLTFHDSYHERLKEQYFDLYGFSATEMMECLERVRLYVDREHLTGQLSRLGFMETDYRRFGDKYVVVYTKSV